MGEAEKEKQQKFNFASAVGCFWKTRYIAWNNATHLQNYFNVSCSFQAFVSFIVHSSIFHPHALSKIISYFNPGQTEMTKNDLYLWSGLLIGVNLIDVFYAHNYHMEMAALGIKIRAAFCSFIYRKALKLNPAQLGDISIGKIVTLITKDVSCLERFSYLVNDLWIAGLKAGVAGYVVYRKINVAAFAGVGFFFLILPIQGESSNSLI